MFKKLFWPFTISINCSSDLKYFANSRPSASNLKSFSQSLEQFFLTVSQNNFGNKIPFVIKEKIKVNLKTSRTQNWDIWRTLKTFVCIWAAKNWVTADVNAGVNALHLLSYGLMLSWVNTILLKIKGMQCVKIISQVLKIFLVLAF